MKLYLFLSSFFPLLFNEIKCEQNIVKLIPPDDNEEFIRYSKKRDEIYENRRRQLEDIPSGKQQLHGHRGGRVQHLIHGNNNITSILNPRKPWMALHSVDGLQNTEVAVFLISSSFREGLYLRSRYIYYTVICSIRIILRS